MERTRIFGLATPLKVPKFLEIGLEPLSVFPGSNQGMGQPSRNVNDYPISASSFVRVRVFDAFERIEKLQ